MIVAISCDHGGFHLKPHILDAIQQAGHIALDLGSFSTDMTDYPDHAQEVGKAIITGQAQRGILICGSGVGICIAANKIKGIYAGLCHDTYSAHQGVEHDNMNVLCLGGRVIGSELAKELVKTFLMAEYHPEERYERRFAKMLAIENKSKK
jgi:ribose 5-phosphate isomerase B